MANKSIFPAKAVILTTGCIFFFLSEKKMLKAKGRLPPQDKTLSKSYFILSPKQHDVNSLGIAGGN